MLRRYRTIRLNALSTSLLLVFGVFTAPPVSGQEIGLVPGQSCLSAGCHEDLGQKNVVHMPAASGTTCVFCHAASEPGRHEFKLAAQGSKLCAGCHNVLGDKRNQHMPVKMGMCTMCHEPHQSDNRKLLKARPVSKLCFGCHSESAFQDKVTHGPVEEGSCTGCHEPHASDHARLIKAAMPELCFECHNRNLRDADGKSLSAAKKTFDDETLTKHMPFGIGQCAMCHAPHASPNHRLLNAPYPAEFYTSYSEDKYFCFGCHDAGAFAAPRTLTATEFRNGDLNLHFRHVNRDKGRTCRACHDHHAAENPKLIRDSVPFGNRFISITNFELTASGGQCGPTCHALVKYDRLEAEENALKVSPRQGEDASFEEPERLRQEQMK